MNTARAVTDNTGMRLLVGGMDVHNLKQGLVGFCSDNEGELTVDIVWEKAFLPGAWEDFGIPSLAEQLYRLPPQVKYGLRSGKNKKNGHRLGSKLLIVFEDKEITILIRGQEYMAYMGGRPLSNIVVAAKRMVRNDK